MAEHFIRVCDEHGTIIAQCRCPSKDKTVTRVPCPGPAKCSAASIPAPEELDVGTLSFRVVEAARRFLEANDAAAIAGSRPTDPDVAYIAGVPVFNPVEATRLALISRDARDAFREALAAYDEAKEERA